MSMEDFIDTLCLLNVKDLLKYGAFLCSLGDIARILSALDETEALTVSGSPHALRGGDRWRA